VSMFRDRMDSEPVASARIEDSAVRFKAPAAAVSRPSFQDAPYRSPDQVTSRLIKMAES